MEDFFVRAWEQLTGRLTGPMWFRFLVQPSVAVGLAVRAGWRDAAATRPPFLSAMVSGTSTRRALLADLWKDVGRLCVIAFSLDVIYQLVMLDRFYPVQAVIVTCLLGVVPYVVVRGPVGRLARAARSTRIGACVAGILLLTGATALAIDHPRYRVKTTIDSHFDFGVLKTYCWAVGWPAYDKDIDRAVVLAVDQELTARGLTRRTSEPCDVLATYESLRRTDVDFGAKAAPHSKLRRQYDVGTLIVLLKRPQSGVELFRGRVDEPLKPELSQQQEQVRAAIAEMFEEYPVARAARRE